MVLDYGLNLSLTLKFCRNHPETELKREVSGGADYGDARHKRPYIRERVTINREINGSKSQD